MLDINSVQSYKNFIRNAAVSRVSESLFPEFKTVIWDDLSTPLLTWGYYDTSRIDSNLIYYDLCHRGIIVSKTDPTNSTINNSQNGLSLCKAEESYQSALNVISSSWPQLYELIEIAIEKITLPPCHEVFESASDPQKFGLIYYNMKSISPLKWVEILAHEVGHHYLFALSASRAFKAAQNWSEPKFSSIRNEVRPLIGLLHAVIAESFIIIALNAASNRGCSDELSNAEYDLIENLTLFSSHLMRDFSEIQDENITMPHPSLELILQRGVDLAKCHLKRV